MSIQTMITLSELSFNLGLIDISEYEERIEVAYWLSAEDSSLSDPREMNDEESALEKTPDYDYPVSESVSIIDAGKTRDSDWQLELIVLKKWYFTRSDPDPYPSVPHGHLNSATRPWPKLNPYTGRAFKAKHQEETSLRLSKREMRDIWRAETFRNYCRSHIVWYMETHPYFTFRVRHPMRLPLW